MLATGLQHIGYWGKIAFIYNLLTIYMYIVSVNVLNTAVKYW